MSGPFTGLAAKKSGLDQMPNKWWDVRVAQRLGSATL
jgi:hypothetical protein